MFVNETVNAALLLGTPGIGKSLFLRWLMATLAREAIENNISMTVRFATGTYDYFCSTNGSVVAYNSHSKPDYFFSDSVDICNLDLSKKLTLFVSSDDAQHYKEWKKRMQEAGDGARLWYMPVFSLEELVCIRVDPLTVADIEFRYKVVGGSARAVVSGVYFPSDSHIRQFVAMEFEWFFTGCDISETNKIWAIQIVTDALKGATDEKNAKLVFHRMFKHQHPDARYANPSLEWSSKFLQLLAEAVIENKEKSMYSELKKIFGYAGVGCGFEYLGHQCLTAKSNIKKEYSVRRLREDSSEELTLTLNVERRVFIRCIDDIGKLKSGDYGLPTISNFPLIDSVIHPDILIQFTTSDRHEGATNKLTDILEQLHMVQSRGKREKPKMIFMVPRDKVNTFKFVAGLPGVEQFVTTYELAASNEASGIGQSPNKRRKK